MSVFALLRTASITSVCVLLSSSPLVAGCDLNPPDPPTDDDDDSSPGACVDADGDGYGTSAGDLEACAHPEEDCDDGDASIHPGADEGCDGVDTDCDGSLGAEELDDDGDGVTECDGDCDDGDAWANLDDADGDGYSTCDGDCDDGDATVYDGAPELCDGLDNDCDGAVPADETDDDGDGYNECADGDCDDAAPSIHPGASETWNDHIDDDCDGTAEIFEDDFDDANDGDSIVGRPGWSTGGDFGASSEATISADQYVSCCLSLCTNSGSGEGGHQSTGFAEDFTFEAYFYDVGFSGSGNFVFIFRNLTSGPVFHAGWSSAWGAADYYVETSGGAGIAICPASPGWHFLSVRVEYTTSTSGAYVVCIDGSSPSDCVEGTFSDVIEGFNLNDDNQSGYIDDIHIYFSD